MIDEMTWSFIQTKDEGVPLILLPGSQGTGDVYANQILALGSDIRIIAVTFPASDDCHVLANGFKSFLAALGIPRAVISGSSFGGLWLQFFAAEFPESVIALILANTFIDSSAKHALFDQILALSDADLIAVVQRGFIASAEKGGRHAELAQIMGSLVGPVQSGDVLRSRLRGVRLSEPAPRVRLAAERVTLIECDDDPLVDQAMRDEMAARYNSSARHILQGGEHYPAILKPEEYSAILQNSYAAAMEREA